jgi:SAM-dependent methyltransferase
VANAAGGYAILKRVAVAGADVLEIGASEIRHADFWNGKPASLDVVDTSASRMELTRSSLQVLGVQLADAVLVDKNWAEWNPMEKYDLVLAFSVLEHLYPLENYLSKLVQALKPGGRLVGAVPCEGGVDDRARTVCNVKAGIP